MNIHHLQQHEKEDAYTFCKEVFLNTENFFSSEEMIKPFLDSVEHFTSTMELIGAYEEELRGIIGYEKDTCALLLFLMKEENDVIKKNLFQYYLDYAKERQLARVGAMVSLSAKSFYEELGFEQVEPVQTKNEIEYIVMEYLLQKEDLGKEVTVIIDYPYGSMHPLIGEFCTCNCGYVDDSSLMDKEFQDAYVIGVKEPLETYTGIVVGILYRKHEQYSKWIIYKDKNYDKEEVIQEIAFIEQHYDSRIIWL